MGLIIHNSENGIESGRSNEWGFVGSFYFYVVFLSLLLVVEIILSVILPYSVGKVTLLVLFGLFIVGLFAYLCSFCLFPTEVSGV